MSIIKEKCLEDLSAAGENIQREAERLLALVQSVQSMPRPNQASDDKPALAAASSLPAELADTNGPIIPTAEKSNGREAILPRYPCAWTAVALILIYVAALYCYTAKLWEIRSSVLYAPLEMRLRKFLDHSSGPPIVSNFSLTDDGCECRRTI